MVDTDIIISLIGAAAVVLPVLFKQNSDSKKIMQEHKNTTESIDGHSEELKQRIEILEFAFVNHQKSDNIKLEEILRVCDEAINVDDKIKRDIAEYTSAIDNK